MPLPIPNPSHDQKEGTEEFYDSCKNTDKKSMPQTSDNKILPWWIAVMYNLHFFLAMLLKMDKRLGNIEGDIKVQVLRNSVVKYKMFLLSFNIPWLLHFSW